MTRRSGRSAGRRARGVCPWRRWRGGYALKANLLFTWLRDPRFAPTDVDTPGDAGDDTLFRPGEISGLVAGPGAGADLEAQVARAGPVPARQVAVTLVDGRRVVVETPPAPAAVLGLVQGLMT